eukprot:TRINITY_DN1733_c1_g1_i4.p1 TRINITY_DN1733_c1_g1~~TRINITY_DN1733_c1_g1_i4.p1  ORF type:complete len:382 (+),score=83.06 TRINITY_DN1733_c1_g1_i4:107-1252(+)
MVGAKEDGHEDRFAELLDKALHTMVFLIGVGAVASLSAMVVLARPFDAVMAGFLVVVSQGVYSLRNEHHRLLDSSKFGDGAPVRPAGGGEPGLASDAAMPHDADEAAMSGVVDDLDLTGLAGSLGVVVYGGSASSSGAAAGRDSGAGVGSLAGPEAGAASGGTRLLDRLLLNAVSREYLRCVSALRSYQALYGPLEPDQAPFSSYEGISIEVPCDRAGLNDPALFKTLTPRSSPRSPKGPPSPDTQRGLRGNDVVPSEVLPVPSNASLACSAFSASAGTGSVVGSGNVGGGVPMGPLATFRTANRPQGKAESKAAADGGTSMNYGSEDRRPSDGSQSSTLPLRTDAAAHPTLTATVPSATTATEVRQEVPRRHSFGLFGGN